MFFYRHTTGIHYTDEIVEWAVLRKTRSETETLLEGSTPIPDGFFEQDEAPLFPAGVLTEIRKNFRGVVTVALPSSQLLMRVLELPSTDPKEITGMVELQMDQISPFPADQLTLSYELLKESENHSRVLAVAAPRNSVDELGELFKSKNVYIRSLDAEILAWWSLLVAHSDVPSEGRVILILEEHTEFSMIVVDDGVPVCFRSLELFHDFTDESVLREIAEELRYTLLSLEAEYGHRDECAIEFWSESEVPKTLLKMLGEECSGTINLHDLGTLPSMAGGLALRSADRTAHHVELVPREWIELQRKKRFMQVATIASIAVLSVWLGLISITGAVFAFQKASFNHVKGEAAKYSAPARAAQAAREEMLSLEKYADRSRSALECLLGITQTLPHFVEITSFTYTKGKAIRLSGTGDSSDLIYDYFQKLGEFELFEGVKNTKITDTRFSITVNLPKPETEEL